MLVGKMAHKVIELYMLGTELEKAIESETLYLDTVADNEVKWGKT